MRDHAGDRRAAPELAALFGIDHPALLVAEEEIGSTRRRAMRDHRNAVVGGEGLQSRIGGDEPRAVGAETVVCTNSEVSKGGRSPGFVQTSLY